MAKHFKFILIVGVVMFLLFGVLPQSVSAAIVPCGPGLPDPVCDICDIFVLGDKIIDYVTMQLVPYVALLLLMAGGFMIMTSGGSEDRYKKGRGIITMTILGLVIIWGAWLAIDAIMGGLAGMGSGSLKAWNKITCVPPVKKEEIKKPAVTPAPAIDFSGLKCSAGSNCYYQKHPSLIGKDSTGANWTDLERNNLYTHNEALAALQNSGIAVSPTSILSANHTCIECTSLNGMPRGIVDSLIDMRNSCSNCALTITGGTEVGHISQGFGRASIDARYNESAYNYLNSSGASQGLTVVRERPWDVSENGTRSCAAGWQCYYHVTAPHLSIYKNSASVY